MKSEVIDQGALKGAVKSAVSGVLQGKAAAPNATKGGIVSNEPKNRGGRVRRALEVGAEQEAHGGFGDDAIDMDFSEAELREFLSADYLETQADPAFKETLRKKLWSLVSDRYGRGPSSTD